MPTPKPSRRHFAPSPVPESLETEDLGRNGISCEGIRTLYTIMMRAAEHTDGAGWYECGVPKNIYYN